MKPIIRQAGIVRLITAVVPVCVTLAACGGSSPNHTTTVAALPPATTHTAPPPTRAKRGHARNATHPKSRVPAKTTLPVARTTATTQTQPVTHAAASTTTTKVATSSTKLPVSTTSHAPKPKTPTKLKPTEPQKTRPPTVTTTGATSVSGAYTGPDPLYCLQKAGLSDARIGVEQGIWQANIPGTVPSDSKMTIFINGPLASDTEASQYASELRNIPETAVAGGRWVVSAAVTGHLDFQVSAVASCMTG